MIAKKFFFLLFCSFLILSSTSCKKCECPAWDDHYSAWFPYHPGDTIRMANLSGDTLSFYISGSSTSLEYEIDERFREGCVSSYHFDHYLSGSSIDGSITRYTDDFAISLHIIGRISDSVTGYGVYKYVSRDLDQETNSISLFGENYPNSIILKKDTNVMDQSWFNYWKVLISRDYGVIALFGKDTDDIWTLVP